MIAVTGPRARLLICAFAALLLLTGVAATPAGAAVADPDARLILRSPSGDGFGAKPFGDERYHGYETLDGYTVVRDDDGTRGWEYAKAQADGDLVDSGLEPGSDDPRGIDRHLRDEDAVDAAEQKAATQQAQAAPGVFAAPLAAASPTGGVHRSLVILAQFRGDANGNGAQSSLGTTPAEWHDLFFGRVHSLDRYYREASRGDLSFDPASETYGTPGDGIVGWVTLDRPHPNGMEGSGLMVKDAIAAADPYVDFRAYDTNGDYVLSPSELHITVIPAGREQATSCGPPYMWAHRGGTTAATAEGVRASTYTTFGEMQCKYGGGQHMATLGVIAHELGHDVGMPDLYDTNGNANNDPADAGGHVGHWDLMASGNWAERPGELNGQTPTHPSAFLKAMQGWGGARRAAGTRRAALETAALSGSSVRVGENPGGLDWQWGIRSGTGHYFLLENRQRYGYDASIPGCGVVLWRIDESAGRGTANAYRRSLVRLESADANGVLSDAGDAWTGGTFDVDTNPSSRDYDGNPTGASAREFGGCAPTASPLVADSTTPAANNDLGHATTVGSLPLPPSPLDVRSADLEPGEPTSWCGQIEKSVWYRYTPGSDVSVTALTQGSSFDTVVGLYQGTSMESLSEIGCNDDGGPNGTSVMRTTLSAGRTYYFQVGGHDATNSNLEFALVRTPETIIDSGPSGTKGPADNVFQYRSEPAGDTTYECRHRRPSQPLPAWESCPAGSRDLGALEAGEHTFDVRATGRYGGVDPTPATRTWWIDATPAETTLTSGPSGTAGTTAAFSFTSEAGAVFECRLTAPSGVTGWNRCFSPKQYDDLRGGQHTFEVRARDRYGNVDSTPAVRTWTVDSTPPKTVLSSGPSGPINSRAATFVFTATDAARYECRLRHTSDGWANWTACDTGRVYYTGLAEGHYTFDVRAFDSYGNADPVPVTRYFIVDTVAPDTTVTIGPSGPTASAEATFWFDTPEWPQTFECRVLGPGQSTSWAACESGKTYTGLANASYTFEVRARDAAGNLDPTPATRAWSVDTVAPSTSLSGGPPELTNNASATFSLATSSGATLQCRLARVPETAEWAACPASRSYSGLADGAYKFEARGVDAAGNVDATPATHTWTIDTQGPDTAVSGWHPRVSSATSSRFGFYAMEFDVTFECRLRRPHQTSESSWQACSPGHELSFTEGEHTFEVRGRDKAGNFDPSPAKVTWTVDTTAPVVTLDPSGPTGATRATSATFAFSADDAEAAFQCRLLRDGDPETLFAGCESPRSYAGLADGRYTFEVLAHDEAGNSNIPASRTWTVGDAPDDGGGARDSSPPDTWVTSGPPASTAAAGATFTLIASEAGARFECRLDTGPWGPCNTPHQVRGLVPGRHTLSVRAEDAHGNIDASPATWAWRVDPAWTPPGSGTPEPGPDPDPEEAPASPGRSSAPGSIKSRQLSSKGLTIGYSCTRACTYQWTLTIPGKVARAAGLRAPGRALVIGSARVRRTSAGSGTVRLKLRAKPRSRLKGRAFKATVLGEVYDPAVDEMWDDRVGATIVRP